MMYDARHAMLASAAAGALIFGAVPAVAQVAPDSIGTPETDTATPQDDGGAAGPDIVVTGIRGSIAQSLTQKREAVGVVDVITAEDIGKLPDQNIAESISRIPGVQITRRDGEGNGFAIRGLGINRVEINGRAYTGPNQNASPNLQTLNPEILAGVEVTKAPSADQIEGSLGGTVNLKTRRPLDTRENLVGSGRVQLLYGDLLEHVTARGSALVSAKFDEGRIGVLGAIAYGRTDGIAQGFSTGGYRETTSGSGIFQPNRIVSQQEARDQRRMTANAAIQWKPDDDTDVVLEGTYSKFTVDRNLSYYQILLTPNAALGQMATLADRNVLSDGTLAQATFNNVTVRPLAYYARTDFESLNIGGTGERRLGNLTLTVDGSYSKGQGSDGGSGAPFTFVVNNSRGNTANISYDLLSNKVHPDYSLAANYDVNDPQAYQLASIYDGSNDSDNEGYDGRFDAQYDFDGGWLRLIKAGVRYERIHLYAQNPQATPGVNAAILAAADANGDGVIRPDELSGLNYNYQYTGNFLPGIGGNFPHRFLTGIVDPERAREDVGIGAPPPLPLTVKDVTQRTLAGYVMANLGGEVLGKTVRLNVGGRYVSTRRTSSGFAGTSNTAPVTPVSSTSTFNDFLPSGNLSVDLTDKLVFRLSAAKVIARPDLSQVGPGLIVNSVNFSASTGNPNLKPFKSTQQDATLEWYLAPASILSLALFNKDVNSFTVQTTSQVTLPIVGVPTEVTLSQPQNGSSGNVKGFEVSWQQAFRFLPGALGNTGIQANYTFADSKTPIVDPLNPSETLPLSNLSRNSYSVIGYYEDDVFSARLAYTYRDRFLSGLQAKTLGGSVWTDSFGQLDATATLNITDRVQLVMEGTSLNRPLNREYTGTTNRTSLTFINDRRFAIGFAAKF